MDDMVVEGNTVLVSLADYILFAGIEFNGQTGNVLSINVSNPAAPTLAGVLFGSSDPNANTTQQGVTIVNSQIAYVASSTNTGGSTQDGEGRVLVVNYSNPASLAYTQLLIPGTYQVVDVSVQGNEALVVGRTGGTDAYGVNGTMTLSLLSISNPQSPTLLGTTLITQGQFPTATGSSHNKISALPLGNGLFAVSEATVNGNPELMLVDPGDPNNILVTYTAGARAGERDGGFRQPALHKQYPGADDLQHRRLPGHPAERVGRGAHRQPVDRGRLLQHPADIGHHGHNLRHARLERDLYVRGPDIPHHLAIHGGHADCGRSRAGDAWRFGHFHLRRHARHVPDARYVGYRRIDHQHSARVANRAARRDRDLRRATHEPDEQLGDLQQFWRKRCLGQHTTCHGRARCDRGRPLAGVVFFDPRRRATRSYRDSRVGQRKPQGTVQAHFILAGTPIVQPKANAYGVVATLTPSQATAGQETSAAYVVQVTNTGSTEETYREAVGGLPGGGTSYSFGPNNPVSVPPGESNFVDLPLSLSVGNVTPGVYPFTVTISATDNSSSTTIDGTINVVASGVSVYLSPSGGVTPGGTIDAQIYNRGSATDTFNLVLSGPAALAANIGPIFHNAWPGSQSAGPDHHFRASDLRHRWQSAADRDGHLADQYRRNGQRHLDDCR